MATDRKTTDLKAQIEELKHQLSEAQETIEMIRTGQVDALVVHDGNNLELYTLTSADQAYRMFVEKMMEGAVTLDKSGNIIYCNSSFARMLGLPLDKVIGHPLVQFVIKNDHQALERILNVSLQEEVKAEMNLISITSGREKIMPIQLSTSDLNYQEGSVINMLITDLTQYKLIQNILEEKNEELRLINQALESSNHDLQQFASVASHDLQEPLRKIQMFTDLLQQRGKEIIPESLINYLNKIKLSASRMRTLISDVLHFSKLSEENIADEWVEVEKIIGEIMDDFELMIKEKQAIITTGKLPGLYANKGQVRQAFQNIIANALKFSKPGHPPRISITGKRLQDKSFDSDEQKDGPYCLFNIRDNGIGFNEMYTSNIFEMFQRLHIKEAYEGSGIGLAITKKIMDKHHGLVNAKSNIGEGSEFLLLFPYNRE